MDDLTIARHCAKALAEQDPWDKMIWERRIAHGNVSALFTSPAIAFRLVGWLAERGFMTIDRRGVIFSYSAIPDDYEEPYTTPESLCAAVAKIVARVVEEQG